MLIIVLEIDIVEFLQNDSGSSDISIYEEAIPNNSAVRQKLFEVSQTQIKNKFSYKSAADVRIKRSYRRLLQTCVQIKQYIFCFVYHVMSW